MINLIYTGIFNNCDAPSPWGLYFQDSATPQMEGLELGDNIMFYLANNEKIDTPIVNLIDSILLKSILTLVYWGFVLSMVLVGLVGLIAIVLFMAGKGSDSPSSSTGGVQGSGSSNGKDPDKDPEQDDSKKVAKVSTINKAVSESDKNKGVSETSFPSFFLLYYKIISNIV